MANVYFTRPVTVSFSSGLRTVFYVYAQCADVYLADLRYADRAKQIKNKPKVNIDPTELLIQQLKEENERLKQQFGDGGVPAAVGGGPMSEEEKAAMKAQVDIAEYSTCYMQSA